MLIAGYVPNAAEALEWGLVSELVPSDRVLARASEIATRLAAGPTFAYAQMRKLLLEGHAQTLGEYLTHETAAMLASGDMADAAEGVSAFVEHRAPRFSGQATPEEPR
jgi:2-(1,2-epoxy-1,2-dihydrophenyl)acetyl-CoA isomerase